MTVLRVVAGLAWLVSGPIWLSTFGPGKRFWGGRGFRVRRVRSLSGMTYGILTAVIAVGVFGEALKAGQYLLAFATAVTVLLFVGWYSASERLGWIWASRGFRTRRVKWVLGVAAIASLSPLGYVIEHSGGLDNALLMAAQRGSDPALIAQMISHGAKVDSRTPDGQTPLMIASYFGHVAVVRVLIANGADVNAKTELGATPLMAAAQGGDLEIARLLLEHGADPNSHSNDGRTAFAIAQNFHHPEIQKLLANHGAAPP